MQYPVAIVDTSILLNNIKAVKQLSPESKILAIVKSNAYGHGLTKVAHAIHHSVDGLGVARISEAELLRASGIKSEILLLEGFFTLVELLRANELGLATVVHSWEQLQLIEAYASQLTDLHVWVKYNTGMNRLGLDSSEVVEVIERLEKLPCVTNIKIMSHLARADDLQNPNHSEQQFELFYAMLDKYQYEGSISASAGIVHYQQRANEWIRPGIMIYGISPTNESIDHLGFQPAMTLETILIAKHLRNPGDCIGYGGTYEVTEPTYIGVVAIGYGDGYPRGVPAGTPMYINGRRVPIVGRVSMDMVTVDLGLDSTDKVGDKVEVFGKNIRVEELSAHYGISWEYPTKLTQRVKWVYKID